MVQLNFSIQINAPKEKVWHTMLDDTTYSQWTSAFGEGSSFVGDWSEGSKIQFLGGSGSAGISSRIARHIPNEYLSILHLGVIANGVEDFDSEETKKWSGALENYAVQEKNGVTTLSIKTDTTEDFEAYFRKKWPKALEKLKALSETA
jgi:hypothetical protein